jgi:hypothetical protein
MTEPPESDNVIPMPQDRTATYMTPQQFAEDGERCFGWGWQQALARHLGFNRSQIIRYAQGYAPIPIYVAICIDALTADLDAGRAIVQRVPVGRVEDEKFIPA